MNNKTHYQNGQKIYEQKGNTLTYFFKTGIVKAKGKSIHGKMEGKWIFNRESGMLWQVGNFKNGKKHGSWVRYNKVCKLEYKEMFVSGKIVKPESTTNFPKISAPAERALASAGVTKLEQLSKYTEKEIADLHGMGPKAIRILRSALKTKGKTFKKK